MNYKSRGIFRAISNIYNGLVNNICNGLVNRKEPSTEMFGRVLSAFGNSEICVFYIIILAQN